LRLRLNFEPNFGSVLKSSGLNLGSEPNLGISSKCKAMHKFGGVHFVVSHCLHCPGVQVVCLGFLVWPIVPAACPFPLKVVNFFFFEMAVDVALTESHWGSWGSSRWCALSLNHCY